MVSLRYILLPFISLVFLFSVTNYANAGNVYGKKYASIIIDQKDSKILYSRGANLKRYPASLTKIMTLYIVFEDLKTGKLKLTQKFKASRRAVKQPPSCLGLGVGERITVKNAILALVTKSANDVAVTIAENISGSERQFARRMTATARKLGMNSTTFKNASGLHNYSQVTTAYDMSILGANIYKNFPEYYHYFSTKTFQYQGVKYGNHNKLLSKYKGTDGIKTGYIRASGFNLVSSVKRGDTRLIGVVFGGVSGARRDLHMMYLLNKGFRVTTHMATRPMDKTETSTYAITHNKKVSPTVTTVAKVNLNKREEQGSKTPTARNWSVQVGAYINLTVARNATKKVIALLPYSNDLTVEILEIKKRKK